MKKNTAFYLLLGLLIVTPAVSFAALSGLTGLLKDILDILGLVEKIVFALAFIFFFYGMGQFILHSGDAKLREEGKSKMIWGVVALFVMLSIIGILNFVGGLVGISPGGVPTIGNTSQNCITLPDGTCEQE